MTNDSNALQRIIEHMKQKRRYLGMKVNVGKTEVKSIDNSETMEQREHSHDNEREGDV